MFDTPYFHETLILDSFFIDSKYRGKGVGTAALQAVFKFVKEETTYKHMLLDVLEGNEAARKLYKGFGFTDYVHVMFKETF